MEVIGGFWTNSLALLSDAGHMLSDIAALGLSLGAIWFSVKPAHEGKTFGYFRAEILVAFVNGGILIAIATVIFHEAYHRILSPQEVKAIPMVGIATAGLIVNLFAAILLFKGSTYSMNIRAVLFHVAGDALGSLGAITAGVVIWLRGWNWFDPLISFFIGSIIIYGAWHLLWETTHILMQGTPSHLQTNEIKQDMMNVEGVHCVNDLHIWTLTSHVDILTAHVVVNDVRNGMNILTDLHVLLRNKYGLEHVTIQLEEESMGNCRLFD
ncbi:MAG: cation transporter [Deltaproteobacteria bacterium]|nr:cation transporter [Deltaproteobacteria bacterium]